MSNLSETVELECPTFFALHHAERFFTLHRRDHTDGKLTLRVDLSSLKLPSTSQALHHVRVMHQLFERDGTKRIALSWDPDDRSVPRFDGMLSCYNRDSGRTALTLEGTYTPPFGFAGAAFDFVLGRKIAAATARALLDDMKEFIESDFRRERATSLASSPKE